MLTRLTTLPELFLCKVRMRISPLPQTECIRSDPAIGMWASRGRVHRRGRVRAGKGHLAQLVDIFYHDGVGGDSVAESVKRTTSEKGARPRSGQLSRLV